MKFIAFLRDSYREALSGWILQAMIVLALLLIFFVASVSFRPITLKEELDTQYEFLNWAMSRNPDQAIRNSKYSIENFSATNEKEPWKSDYKFDLVVSTPSREALSKIREAGLPVRRRQIEMLMTESLKFLKQVEVVDAPLPKDANAIMGLTGIAVLPLRPGAPPGEARYTVTSKGTTADDALAWRHEPTILFGINLSFFTMSLREGVYTLQKRLVNDAGAWITLLVSIVVTAGFIPNMLRKGALDLYIAKPISRPMLLIYKYLGGLLYVLILISVLVFGVWIAIGLRTGLWTTNFLALIPLITFYFAILYAVSTLAGVLTRSMLMAIVATVFAWGVIFLVGWVHEQINQFKKTQVELQEKFEKEVPKGESTETDGEPPPPPPIKKAVPEWLDVLVSTAHAVLPRTYDLDDRAIRIIAEGVLTEAERKQKKLDTPLTPWPETIGVSLAFIALCLGLSCWRLNTRDG